MALLLVSGVVSLTIYRRVAVLEPASRHYTASLSPAVSRLHKSCQRLATTSDQLFYDKAPTTLEGKTAALTQLTGLVTDLRTELKTFRKTAETLPDYPYPFASPQYEKSRAIEKEAEATTSQINEVLDEYSTLLTFLATFYPTRQHLEDELASFNSTQNLDELASQSLYYSSLAQQLIAEANVLAAQKPPRGFEAITAKSVAVNQKAAEDFSALAASFSPPTDSVIAAAATNLEALTVENDSISNEDLDTVLLNSPILTGVSDLPETTDRFRL